MATPPVIQSASPLWEDLRTDHAAKTYRRWLRDEWPAQGVVHGWGGINLTSGPGLGVTYPAFSAIVHSADADDGAYYVSVEAGSVTLPAAHGSNPRFDLVVLTVRAGTGDAVIDVVQGTAAVSPVVPSVPSQSIPVAAVRVNAGVTSPTLITDRTYRACKRGLTLLNSGTTTLVGNVTGARDILSTTLTVPPGRTCIHVEFSANLPALGSNVVQDIGFWATWKINGTAAPLTPGGGYSRIFAANGLSGQNNWLDQLNVRQVYSFMPAGSYTIALGMGMSTTTSAYDIFPGLWTIRIEY